MLLNQGLELQQLHPVRVTLPYPVEKNNLSEEGILNRLDYIFEMIKGPALKTLTLSNITIWVIADWIEAATLKKWVNILPILWDSDKAIHDIKQALNSTIV